MSINVTLFGAVIWLSRYEILHPSISTSQFVGISGQNQATFVTSTSSSHLSADSRREAVGVERVSARRGTSPERARRSGRASEKPRQRRGSWRVAERSDTKGRVAK